MPHLTDLLSKRYNSPRHYILSWIIIIHLLSDAVFMTKLSLIGNIKLYSFTTTKTKLFNLGQFFGLVKDYCTEQHDTCNNFLLNKINSNQFFPDSRGLQFSPSSLIDRFFSVQLFDLLIKFKHQNKFLSCEIEGERDIAQ